ncbi:MAG: RNA-directed DNA polymerase [Pyrinomonadaceae bacterium]|nr:RNA-directed DNA polymerase [Pyrinomonadaceae bacterium]
MKRLVDVTEEEARQHFLKASSYFNNDLPSYISFEPVLKNVAKVLGGKEYASFQSAHPKEIEGVNYNFIANKDGRFAWRPFELIHPAIYVSLVDTICSTEHWKRLQERLKELGQGVVECCSIPVISTDQNSDTAAQVRSWWQRIEQRSLAYSLEYDHLLHTDVTDCYGSLYTHSIVWAIHGYHDGKRKKDVRSLLGNKIDAHIRAGRSGQTNGIAQGSVLMDFIAELVLAYVDSEIDKILKSPSDVKILRYRDDYRIFAHSDNRAEEVLKVVSDALRGVGMRLGVSKTIASRNVVAGSIKPDKLAGIELRGLGEANAKTIQKQLLRLHAFGMRFPNSGALKRLVSELHSKVSQQNDDLEDLNVQIAIATDIAVVSPATFPAVAGILSFLVAKAPTPKKQELWDLVRQKMKRVPYNEYLEVWLQRVILPKAVGLRFDSKEPLCKIVNGQVAELWNNSWISSKKLISAVDVSQIVVGAADDSEETVKPAEVELFTQNAWAY